MPTRREMRAQAFEVIYLGLGPDRSLDRLYEKATELRLEHVPTRTTLAGYSKDFGWVEKAAEFDRQRMSLLREQTLERAIVNDIEHAQFGRAMRLAVEDALKGYQHEDWKPNEIARMGREAVNIERLASGQATERREILLPFVNMLTGEIARAFLTSVAAVDLDPDDEAAIADEFARQVDHIIEQHFVVLGIEAEVDDEEEPDYVDAIASSAD